MSQSLGDIILHIVFSTKGRMMMINPSIEEELYKYLIGVCNKLNCPVIKLNGVEDHLHILLQLDRTISVSQLIAKLKSNSSRWIKSKGENYKNFSWQSGYGVFSVSRSNLESAKNYVDSQKTHHKGVSYKDELIAMLKLAKISYDERHLWD